jgi:hypothetical protein
MNLLKISSFLCFALLAVSSGKASTVPGTQALRIGGDVDAQGCRPATGYAWHAELAQCVRPWLTSVITLEVAPKRSTCKGLVAMQCLLVREIEPKQAKAKSRWEPVSNIAGFTHRPGKRVLLRVRKDKPENPPADAFDFNYTLLKVLP